MYSKTDVYNIIDKNKFDLTFNQYEEVYKYYSKAMKEEINQIKNLGEQTSMITDFAEEVSKNGSLDKTIRRYQDSKFFNNISNIIGERATKQISNVMEDYDFGTKAFIGVKLQTNKKGSTDNYSFTTNDGKEGNIMIKFESNSKYEVENIVIKIDGKEVYNYRQSIFTFRNDNEDDEKELIKFTERDIKRREAKAKEEGKEYHSFSNRVKLSKVKVKKGQYEYHPIEERISDEGRVFYFDRKTKRFATKKNIKNAGF